MTPIKTESMNIETLNRILTLCLLLTWLYLALRFIRAREVHKYFKTYLRAHLLLVIEATMKYKTADKTPEHVQEAIRFVFRPESYLGNFRRIDPRQWLSNDAAELMQQYIDKYKTSKQSWMRKNQES